MNALRSHIDTICATVPVGRQREKALANVRWRLRYGLLCVGLDGPLLRPVLVAPDDPRVAVYDGRDNEQFKARYFSALLGYKFDVDLL